MEYTRRQDLDPGLAYIVNDEAPRASRVLHLMDEDDATRSACGRASTATEGSRMELTMVGRLRHRDYRFCSWCDSRVT